MEFKYKNGEAEVQMEADAIVNEEVETTKDINKQFHRKAEKILNKPKSRQKRNFGKRHHVTSPTVRGSVLKEL